MLNAKSLSLQASSRLESLRGLAAIQVAFFHSFLVLQTTHTNQTYLPAMFVLFNGRAAVTLFFVLSGLVLGLSLRKSVAPISYVWISYSIRRLFRIYPAFLVSTAITCAAIFLYPRFLPLSGSECADTLMPASFTFKTLCKDLLLISHDLNRVTWTLKMEMICSLLLPVCYFSSFVSVFAPWLFLVLSVILASFFPSVISVVVMQAFLIGYVLPTFSELWHKISCNAYVATTSIGVGLCLLLFPRSFDLPFSIITLLEAFGAATIIASVTYGYQIPLFKILDKHLVKVAGRVSYSYYLVHPATFVLVSRVLLPYIIYFSVNNAVVSGVVLWALSSCIAYPLAWLSYRWIEHPMITFSKSLYPYSKVHNGTTKMSNASLAG